MSFDIFISYRRDTGEITGRLFYELLRKEYNVFFDRESLCAGHYDTAILEDIIPAATDVIVLLSHNCLDRCANENDFFMKEINCAIEHNKNIILLMTTDFLMPTENELEKLPQRIRELIRYHGYVIDIGYINGVVDKLRNNLKAPKSPFGSISDWERMTGYLANKESVAMLPQNIKSAVLRGAITSFLDEYNAKIFTSVLDRIEGNISNIRTAYRYDIEITERFSFGDIEIDEDKYYALGESFSYTKKFLTGKPDNAFWLSFTTNLDGLDEDLRDESFFFSENLIIDREDIELLASLDDDAKREFYVSRMRVRLNVNGNGLDPLEIRIDESGIFAKYEMASPESDVIDVKLRFKIPQKNADGYFFASIVEPTYAPKIRFNYPDDEFDVMMIPFLNRSVSAKETKIFDGQRELVIENEWVLPVSGAIFLINKLH